MLKTRVIPTLLLKNFGLVKGQGFDSWRRVGTVLPAIKVYNTREVDELILLDILATEEQREPDYEELENVAGDCFVPLTVGGGITSVAQITKLLRVGADKVSLNSVLFDHPELVSEAAKRFGSQCVVASVDFRRGSHGTPQVVSHRGQKPQNVELISWCQRLESLGAGEILLTSVERDGTMTGYDLTAIQAVSRAVAIPVIASGGAGSYEHLHQAIQNGASAVAAAAIFHYTEQTPKEAKKYLAERGVKVRPVRVGL